MIFLPDRLPAPDASNGDHASRFNPGGLLPSLDLVWILAGFELYYEWILTVKNKCEPDIHGHSLNADPHFNLSE